MSGFTLDAGALIALQKGAVRVAKLLAEADRLKLPIAIPAGVVAQAWRGGPRSAPLARLLRAEGVEVVPLDPHQAQLIGALCGKTGTVDVVDISVVLCARRRGQVIITSDPDDLRRVDSAITLITI
ncbi:MAG TPA: PIN domain-containing protein [Pseudonocardiaceae bacterium]|nr:PIN domain-containing protein [Pseudonocardiaceae bacterium]